MSGSNIYSYIYLGISFVMMVLELILAVKSFAKKKALGTSLGLVLLMSIGVSLSYICSVYAESKNLMSIFSSIYFIFIDYVLICLCAFVFRFTETKKSTLKVVLLCLLYTYSTFETVMFILNPFFGEFAIGYELQETISHTHIYVYDRHLLYNIHLGYSYVIVASILFILIYKIFSVPKEYRNKYHLVGICFVLVVIYNAAFLFIPKMPWNKLDYSILGYGIASCFIYWATFYYTQKGMLNHFKNTIFENINQGLVLFDNDNKLLLSNTKSHHILPNVSFAENMKLNDFLIQSNIALENEGRDDAFSIQCYLNYDGVIHPIRCDYRKLFNKHKQMIGKLFTFVDVEAETDILTGYHNWDSFKRFVSDNKDRFDYPLIIAAADINGLGVYNEAYGLDKGNTLIKNLSNLIKDEFQNDAYYVRGKEAYLIAICYNKTEQEVIEKFEKIKQKFEQKMQFTCLEAKNKSIPLIDYMKLTMDGLSSKKLLDKDSSHSAIINSLVKALQQCDADTESHVLRTQKAGEALGRRIGLSDVDISNLSLLCLLHDIGKIGVPLEILNKPGKLSPDEWKVIQSHVIKGYNIAKSSPELSGIALMIKYHHERWDGKGYPDGLAKESIPVLSRIIAVVDSFDAMVNDRSYRKALPLETAKEEIRKNAGTQFDPYIASEFLRMIEEKKMYTQKKKKTEVAVTDDNTKKEKKSDVYQIEYARYVVDKDNCIIKIDDNFTKLTGYTMEDIHSLGLSAFTLVPENERQDYIALASSSLAKNQMAFFEHRIKCKDGSLKYVLCYGREYYDSVDRSMKSEIIITNALKTHSMEIVSRELENKDKRRLERWEETYRKDSLTGLLTHAAFQNDVVQAIIRKEHVIFFMIDLDNFKKYNDTYGHREGDEFLIAVSQAIQSACGKNDLCCRMGGDEFAIASLGEYNMEEKANAVFSKINFLIESREHYVSFSMGVCEKSKTLSSFQALYERADKLLYEAKEKGRNRLIIDKDNKRAVK